MICPRTRAEVRRVWKDEMKAVMDAASTVYTCKACGKTFGAFSPEFLPDSWGVGGDCVYCSEKCLRELGGGDEGWT